MNQRLDNRTADTDRTFGFRVEPGDGGAPAFRRLEAREALAEGGTCSLEGLRDASAAPALAFVTSEDLRGPGCHLGAVLAAIDLVLPSLDIRAAGSGAAVPARFAVGGRALAPADTDLRTLGVVLEKNGEALAFGAGAAASGHPASAVAALVNHLAGQGEFLPAGSLVLSGGITAPVPVQPGDALTLRAQHMGSLGIRFV